MAVVVVHNDDIIHIDIDDTLDFEDFKALVSINLKFNSIDEFDIVKDGQTIVTKHNKTLLKDYGVINGDVLSLTLKNLSPAFKKANTFDYQSVNELDPEVQKRLEQEILQSNVDRNLNLALEFSPESFAQVILLYINVKVNGQNIKALVDTGAQTTILTNKCAQKCSIGHLIDKRFKGIAIGVGQNNIIGRIHLCDVKIGDQFIGCSFSVLEDNLSVEMILGLDMLRRHQCLIDLKKNCLCIGTTNTIAEFLPESEINSSINIIDKKLH